MNISKKHMKNKQYGYRWKRRKSITWYNGYGIFITRDKSRNTIDYDIKTRIVERFNMDI